MAETDVALVEELRVAAVQPLDSIGQVDALRVEDEVVVGRHQAERVDRPAEALDTEAHMGQEHSAIDVVPRDRAAVDPA